MNCNMPDKCPCMESCPMEPMFKIIGGKWKIRIICTLSLNPPLRYSDIKRSISGITPTMLSQSLRELEEEGIISRTQYDEMPVRVEYSMTEAGMELGPALLALRDWSLKHHKQQ